MRKLKLHLDTLHVESFDSGGPAFLPGTVRGNDSGASVDAPGGPDTLNCPPPGSGAATCASCAATCDFTCGLTCAATCADYTCDRRAYTCDCVPQDPQ